MGSCFNLKTYPASLSKAEVEKQFNALQDQDRYENGHSYSGGFGMATGLSFKENTFATEAEAEGWLVEHAQKWEDALCVRCGTGAAAKWVIGAWCSS